MKRNKDKPGVLIYFDIREPIEVLNYEQRGQLFSAILDYAADGIIPEFDDQIMRMAWAMVKPDVDRDDENYRLMVIKKKYAVYCRSEKEAGREPIPFDGWLETMLEQSDDHVISDDIKRYHTQSTDIQPNYNPTTTQLQPNYNPTTTQQQPNSTTLMREFETLWSLYPRKSGKKDALRHYQKARKAGTTFEEVKAGILNYCEYIKREKIDQRYIMMGSTWFNGEHWNDELKITRQPTTMDLVGNVDLSDWGVTE